ncbi:MAG: hypothetical protein Tsb0013_05570 [Phycisphaerales bacterium]
MSFLTNRFTLCVLLLIASSSLLAVGLRPELVQRSDNDLRTLAEVYTLIQERFREEQDTKELSEAAIAGMIEALDDPYTQYIPPASVRDFDKDVRGEYVGIGAEVDSSEGFLRIASPMDGSPAWNAGLEPDDLIVGVDGVSTFMMPLTDIIDRLLGEPDTEVIVTVERTGDRGDWPDGARAASELEVAQAEEGQTPFEASPPIKAGRTRFDLTITRRPITTVTTKGLYREGEDWRYFADSEDKIAYIRLTQFTDTTPDTLESTLRPLVARGMQGLILDLRYNSGGSLLAAIQTADLFLERGEIVSTRGRGRPGGRALAEKTRDELPWFPMIVLVNEGSASASEIVAGALKDNDRAVILGERTFGKGSVQGVYPLSNGAGALKITEQYYYLPSGKLLHRTDSSTDWGVDPTEGFYVPMDAQDSIEMWRLRREAETLRNEVLEGDWGDPAWILEHFKDPQLSAAVESLRAKVREGVFARTGGDQPAGAIELAALKVERERRELFLDELARIDARIAALENAASEEEAREALDLLPDDATLTDGRLEVYDKDGNVIATLTITGEDLERFLTRAPVELREASVQAPGDEQAEGEDG